jgi:hypothetical protein
MTRQVCRRRSELLDSDRGTQVYLESCSLKTELALTIHIEVFQVSDMESQTKARMLTSDLKNTRENFRLSSRQWSRHSCCVIVQGSKGRPYVAGTPGGRAYQPGLLISSIRGEQPTDMQLPRLPDDISGFFCEILPISHTILHGTSIFLLSRTTKNSPP